MSRTILPSALALTAFFAACSSGKTSQSTTGGAGTGTTTGTTTGSSAPAVSTLASFLVDGDCTSAPTSVAVDSSGNVLTVVQQQLLAIEPDGGTSQILPRVSGIVAVAASNSNTVISEGMPIALYTEQSYSQAYLTGGAQGCADTIAGEDGGVGFAMGRALAADLDENVYVADWSQSEPGCTRIRKIDFDGTTTTLAGTGVNGYKDGPAASAQFFAPSGIAVDKSLNVYVADSFNNRIRMVAADGTTSTIAGNADAGFGDGSGPPNSPSSGTFNLPTGIAVDSSGNLYVADSNNNSIRMITADAGTTTLAGNGQAGFVNGTLGKTGTTTFNFPIGVAVDSMGNVYVADQGNCAIRMIRAQNSH